MMNVDFREVQEEDLERLNEIVNKPQVCRFLVLKRPVSMESTREFYEKRKDSRDKWYSILVDGEVAGAVLLKLNKKDSKQAHVGSFGIDIDEEYWGQGVGSKAMEFIIEKARENGVQRFETEYIRGNSRAGNLYRKYGFQKEGVREKSFKVEEEYCDSIQLVKWI